MQTAARSVLICHRVWLRHPAVFGLGKCTLGLYGLVLTVNVEVAARDFCVFELSL
jgi:hypothetical protein